MCPEAPADRSGEALSRQLREAAQRTRELAQLATEVIGDAREILAEVRFRPRKNEATESA